jgi:hypothetical protein
MSVENCNDKCEVDNYLLSGVEFGHECWCDHAVNDEYHVKVDDSECNMACSGNSTESCGGANRIAIYENNFTQVVDTVQRSDPKSGALGARTAGGQPQFIPTGCYPDSTTNRTLRYYMSSVSEDDGNAMTQDACNIACYVAGYIYAGVEYGQECFCDSSIQWGSSVDQSECNMACPGLAGTTCGGNLTINIFLYIGMESATTPTNWAITVPGVWEYRGCYTDSRSNRTLGFVGDFPGAKEGGMAIERCQGACQNAGYVYAGVEFGSECWCDNLSRAGRGPGVQVSDSECNMTCTRNASEFCGGSNRLNIYQFIPTMSTISTTTLSFISIGCYTDLTSNRTLGFVGDFPGAHGNMTIDPCQGACQNAGYVFAGVEFGDECWCDNVIRGIGAPTSSSDCNMPCSGNASETCGGSNRINIYQLTPATTTNATTSVTSTSTSAVPASATTPLSSAICSMYYTVAENDYCYDIWTDFDISQEQFTSWNPSLVFPQCQISVGQSVCVQQGPAGSTVLTVTNLPPNPTPTDEMPATPLLPTTMTMSGASIAVTPTVMSAAASPTIAVSVSTVSCSVFYQVAQNDYCYEIWTSFGISQDQFTSWNPALVFPACKIIPGDILCVQEGTGSTTTVTALPTPSTPISSSSSVSLTTTMTATLTSTVIVSASMPSMSGGGSLTVTPFTFSTTSTSTVAPPGSISGY